MLAVLPMVPEINPVVELMLSPEGKPLTENVKDFPEIVTLFEIDGREHRG